MNELFEFLRLPSISAQKDHKQDVQKTASWLAKHLKKIGMKKVKVMSTGGHPIVYAEWLGAKNKPTVLIYGHYDVQAPDPLNEWKTKPFEPQIKNGNIYARGTADDKGQIFTHIKAIEALLAVDRRLPVNVKLLIEGEEEVGGPNLDKFLTKNKKLLKSDVCVISDSHSLSEKQPLIVYGLRGLVYTQIDLEVLTKDVHSGEYGGNVPNAAVEVSNLIRKLKDLDSPKGLDTWFL